MPTHTGPGFKAHETEGLGRGGVDDLPDVDAHALGKDRQLVHERDIDRTEDVFKQLGELAGLRRRNAHGVVAHAAAAGCPPDRDKPGVIPPITFGVVRSGSGPTRIDTLWGEGKVDVLPDAQAGGLEQR